MRIAETVTFGSSGLDRAAQTRRDPEALARALARGSVLPMWRGMALCDTGGPVWLPQGHPVLAEARTSVFLGFDDDRPRFAADIPDWLPMEAADASAAGGPDPTALHHPALGTDAGFADLRSIMARLAPRQAELVATARAILNWHQSHGFCAACGARSEVVQGGWQRSCPSCSAQHFPRTDPVVIMLVTHGNAVLLGRSPGWPDGMFSLLAGFMEPGETIEAAVRREVHEETGVTCGAVSYLASQPWPFPASLMIGARTEALGRDIRLDPEELEAALWVTREDLVRVLAGQHPDLRPFRKGAIAEFILRNWLADRLE